MSAEQVLSRLERDAVGGDDVDEMLFELDHGRSRHRSSFEQYEPSEKLIQYTRSTDAVLAFIGRKMPDAVIHAFAKTDYGHAVIFADPDGEATARGTAKTLPVALCLAALRAWKSP